MNEKSKNVLFRCKGGIIIGYNRILCSTASLHLDFAEIAVTPQYIELTVNWVFVIKKYRFPREDITKLWATIGLFTGGTLTIVHTRKKQHRYVEFVAHEKDWLPLKAVLKEAGYPIA